MHQTDAQDRARPGQPRVLEGGAVIGVEDLGDTSPNDGVAQQLLARTSVLVRVEGAVDEQSRVVVDDQEQLGAHRALDPRMRDEGPDQHVGHPALVGAGCFVAAEGLLLGDERLALEATAAQLVAHGALGHRDPVAVEQDPGDLGGRSRRALEAQRAGLFDELGVGAHRPSVSTRLGLQALEPLCPPSPDPAVDGAARIAPLVAVGMAVGAAGDLAHERAALCGGEAFCQCFCDHTEAAQRDLLSGLVVHVVLLFVAPLMAQEA